MKTDNNLKVLLIITSSLILGSFFVLFALSLINSPNSLQLRLYETCETTWKNGFAMLVGLLLGQYRSKP